MSEKNRKQLEEEENSFIRVMIVIQEGQVFFRNNYFETRIRLNHFKAVHCMDYLGDKQ